MWEMRGSRPKGICAWRILKAGQWSRAHSPGLLCVPEVQDAGKSLCLHGAFFRSGAKCRTDAVV